MDKANRSRTFPKPCLRMAMVGYANYFNDARIKNYVDALLDAGARVDVIALGPASGTTAKGRLFVKSVGRKYGGLNSLVYIWDQIRFIFKATWNLLIRSLHKPYDVIHVHNMPNILVLTGLPFKLLGTKVILDVHDTMPEAIATTLELPLESFLVKLLIQEELFSAAIANKVIATNVMHEEVLVGHGIPSHKIIQILNVANGKIFKPRFYQSQTAELWLGYHGTIAKRLGLLMIVEALSLLSNECPGLRFLCVGAGYDSPMMRRRAEEKDVVHMIEWRPFVSVESLPDVLSRVQLGIIGNQRSTEVRKNYMLPVKVLEYAAMEIPSILPRLKILERYFDETSAFFYEPDNADSLAQTLSRLYHNRGLIQTRVDGLRKFNLKYNWNNMAEAYLRTVKELITQ